MSSERSAEVRSGAPPTRQVSDHSDEGIALFEPDNPDESWAQFSARVDSGLKPGGAAPDCVVLGAVYERSSPEVRKEATRLFNFGTSTQARLARRVGRTAFR